MYKHILIAKDDTGPRPVAVRNDVEVAKFVGAEVCFVTVTRPWSARRVRETGGTGTPEEYDEDSAFDAQHILEAAELAAARANVSFSRCHIVTDESANEIRKKALEEAFDLIAIGSPRQHELLRFFDENEALEVGCEQPLSVLIMHATPTSELSGRLL